MARPEPWGTADTLLGARGFSSVGRGKVWVREPSDDVRALVGITSRTARGRTTLTPLVGVRHDRVEALLARLLGADGTAVTPTVRAGLGTLLRPQRRFPQWVLEPDADPAQTWDSLGADLDTYAEPWWAERTTGEGLVRALQAREGGDTSRLALPVLLWVLGREDAALAALDEAVRAGFVPGLVVDVDEFAARLRGEIDAGLSR